MSFSSYNSNNKNNGPMSLVYTPITFSNPESTVFPSKLNVNYYNRVLKLGIATKNQPKANDSYTTYDNDNQIYVYITHTKAKMLHDLIVDKLLVDDTVHNVCVELRGGLLTVSDGSEFGVNSPCIIISAADENGNVTQGIYETKSQYHKGAYNYNKDDNTFDTQYFDNLELDTFITLLDEYFKASTYAVAATVMEASMYKNAGLYNITKAIADKVGASANEGGNKNYNSKSWLGGEGNVANTTPSNSTGFNNGNANFTESSFSDIANNIK